MAIGRIEGSGASYREVFLHNDHLGSPVAATDGGGAVSPCRGLLRLHLIRRIKCFATQTGCEGRECRTPALRAFSGLTWSPGPSHRARPDPLQSGEKLNDPADNRDDIGFTGHIEDAGSLGRGTPMNGLVRLGPTPIEHMQARYYDPVVGRFHSNDPVGFAEGGVGYFNRYAYVLNDPINMTDPTGEFGIAGAIYGAISGGVGGYIASGGNLKATVAGAGVGAAVGAVNPFASNVVGAAAGSAVASAAGQVVGGVVDGQSLGDAVANVDKAAVAGAAVGGAAGRAFGAVAGNATAPIRGSVIGAEVGKQTVSRAPGNVVGSVIEGSAAGAGELAGPHVADAIQEGGTAFFEGVDNAIATEMEHNQQRYDDPDR